MALVDLSEDSLPLCQVRTDRRQPSMSQERPSLLPHTGTQTAVGHDKRLDLCYLNHSGTVFCYDTVLTHTDTVEAHEDGTLRGGPRETWRRLALPLAQ